MTLLHGIFINNHVFFRTKVEGGVEVNVVDGAVMPKVGVETKKIGRPRISKDFRRFSDVMRHIVTKVFCLLFTCLKFTN